MSRGLGVVQLTILIELAAAPGDDTEVVAWSSISALAIWSHPDDDLTVRRDRSERSTWRRGFRSLAERGLVECRMHQADEQDRARLWGHEVLQARLTPLGQRYADMLSDQSRYEEYVALWDRTFGPAGDGSMKPGTNRARAFRGTIMGYALSIAEQKEELAADLAAARRSRRA